MRYVFRLFMFLFSVLQKEKKTMVVDLLDALVTLPSFWLRPRGRGLAAYDPCLSGREFKPT